MADTGPVRTGAPSALTQPPAEPPAEACAPSRMGIDPSPAESGGLEAKSATCEVCGNEYDKTFEVLLAGERHIFDSFECAIHLHAPVCEHCGCRVIGHGSEVDERVYCSAHSARRRRSSPSRRIASTPTARGVAPGRSS